MGRIIKGKAKSSSKKAVALKIRGGGLNACNSISQFSGLSFPSPEGGSLKKK